MNEDPTASDLKQELALVRDTCLVFAARRTSNLLTRVYNASLAGIGLEVTQFTLLAAVEGERAGSAVELARQLGLERSTIARNLDRLITAGLVASRPGEGRRVVYRLTPAGRDRLAQAVACWEEAQAAIVAALPKGGDEAARDQLRVLRQAARRVSGEAS